MKILLTNDDGYDSQGLHAVADLFKREHEVTVVAPSSQRSGYSHSLTLRPNTLTLKKASGYDYPVYAVSGTPVDCVKIAATFVKPDIVISGINNGANLGSDVMYSGTVCAAMDAAHIGFRAVALSLDLGAVAPTRADFDRCARFVKKNFDVLSTVELPHKSFLNINFPSCEPRGVMIVKLSTLYSFIDIYKNTEGDTYVPHGHRDYTDIDGETDEALCKSGYITVSPLLIDITDYPTLEKLKGDKITL